MRRRQKPAKPKVESKPPVARRSPKNNDAKVRDLEQRLAEALEREAGALTREAEALGKLQTRDRDLTEAVEQQTATAQVLELIASSPGDLQPTFDGIVQRARQLCDGLFSVLYGVHGELVTVEADDHVTPENRQLLRSRFPMAVNESAYVRRVFLEHRVVHVEDAAADPHYHQIPFRQAVGYRTLLLVPMLREGAVIGAIGVGRVEPGGFADKQVRLLKTFADQAVIAIENVRLFKELEARNSQLSEALEQQTATAGILQVISNSQMDVLPTFEAIATAATRLCAAQDSGVVRFDGTLMHLMANDGFTAEERDVLRTQFPRPADRSIVTGRAIVTSAVAHVRDIMQDPDYSANAIQRGRFVRAILSVPMLRDGKPIGAITVTRREAEPFSPSQIAVLETFARQAVIAIENVRLFNETKEALKQQTATSEILRVISSSPTDIEPVFDAIVESGMRFCEGEQCVLLGREGGMLTFLASHHSSPEGQAALRASLPIPMNRDTTAGRAILERRVVQIPDVLDDADYGLKHLTTVAGYRATIAVPMMREGDAIGAMTVAREAPGEFSPRYIEILKTFADQAVIAIENVRLFKELQASNRELTTALDKQTATSDILRVISRSQMDVQPVFDAIVISARRLLQGYSAGLFRVVGDQIELVALTSTDDSGDAALRARFPLSLQSDDPHSHAIRDRAAFNFTDFEVDPRVPEAWRVIARARGWRSGVVVPMLRHEEALGTIGVTRREPGGFTDDEIALLKTFADQAVIAIENVRLFAELQEKNQALTEAHAQVSESLEQQTATAEILRVISQSPTDVQPVFDAIVRSAVRLLDGLHGVVDRFDGELIHFAAQCNYTPEALQMTQRMYPRQPDRKQAAGRAILTGDVVNIADAQADPEYATDLAVAGGWRSILNVPMLREGKPIGTIGIIRGQAGRFSDAQVELLRTFADQAVIAIENVRLFTELQEKNRALTTAHAQVSESLDQQTATAEILRVISSSPTDVQPVFDAIVKTGARLCEADFGLLARYDGTSMAIVAHSGATNEEIETALRAFPGPPTPDSLGGRAILERAVIHIPDVRSDPRYGLRVVQDAGWRTGLGVPLLRDGAAIGAVGMWRRDVRPFSDNQIALLKTFADQAVIAIENVRLFKELKRSVDELTALGDVGRALSSTLNLEAVLQTIVTRATQLTETAGCVIWEYDRPREEFRLRVSHYADDTDAAILPAPGGVTTIPRGQGLTTQVMEERQAVQIPDITAEGAYESPVRTPLIDAGHRALLGVPLLSEDQVIGVLAVTRKTPGEFEPEVIRLLSTFAMQSALAIQNARLFQEIADKSRQLEVASQHKSEFLANMSHELRTPLNAIIGFSEVLTERMFGELNEKQEEYLRDIYASGQHLLSLINDILDLSKIEAGRMELELSDFHLPTALDSALTLVRERAGRRSIALQMNIDNRLGEIQADERKVRQVVLNLLSNAIKFTPEGGRIEVRAEPRDGSVEVSVTDTGVGIASEDQEAVFEEFRQVGTADKKVEGTGLGLTLCRKFIELHGGKIWVKSELGLGSTFTFTIPVRRG
jgi:GAF domain-containing protein